MFRTACIIVATLLLSACNTFQPDTGGGVAPPPPAPVTAPPPVEVVACPEPEPLICECPEPKKVIAPVPPAQPCTAGKQDFLIIGAIEHVAVDDTGLIVKARIDTGAKTSSMHAQDLVEFERDGKSWIRFTFDPSEGKPSTTIEKRVVRTVRIKQHGEDESKRRYVIKMRLRMGEIEEIIELSLSDRSDFEYPILIGRNFLTDNAVVDVSKQFMAD